MPHHVLVVEDDPAIRGSLTTALELNGYTVSTAPDGIAALQALKDDGVDLVVLDVGLPGLDGLGVCRLMRSEGMHTPVLMLTARTTTPAPGSWPPTSPATPSPTPDPPDRPAPNRGAPGAPGLVR